MSAKERLDVLLAKKGLAASRSQAESWVKLGKVTVDGRVVAKPGTFVSDAAQLKLHAGEQYVSRAGLKLASVATLLGLDFKGKVVLDVGSSTGGFTDYALKRGAKKVYAVEVGTDQLHPSLRGNPAIELHEKTDIRDIYLDRSGQPKLLDTASRRASLAYAAGDARAADISSNLTARSSTVTITDTPDIVVIDVSFISLRDILPHIARELSGPGTQIVAMVKPQFEAGRVQVTKGVIKNDAVRRQILKDFEAWARQYFVVQDKHDSEVAGAKGNRERFYLLTLNRNSTTSPGRMT
jgi:23S rRNA (cytidine1920-2'-O)/16S rRNA (cytidine1409-2'-O)-methyltransferase